MNAKACIILLAFLPISDLKPIFLNIQTLACDQINPNYCANFSLGYDDNKLNLEVDILRTLRAGLKVNIDFFTRKSRSEPYSKFYKYSLNLCRLLAKQIYNIFKKLFSTLLAYGNFAERCPVRPQHYYIRDYQINDLEMPSFVFAGIYRLNATMIQDNGPYKGMDLVIACEAEVEITHGSISPETNPEHCFLMGKNTMQAKQWIEKCYPDSCPSKATICRWFAEFKRGRTDTNDAERSGRPVEARY